jgi:hypothetical protein
MTKLYDISDDHATWIAARPPAIREMIRRWPPNLLYRLESTGHRVTIHSYFEGGTVTVSVTGTCKLVTFERNVFGVDPATLEECDLPAEGEPARRQAYGRRGYQGAHRFGGRRGPCETMRGKSIAVARIRSVRCAWGRAVANDPRALLQVRFDLLKLCLTNEGAHP